MTRLTSGQAVEKFLRDFGYVVPNDPEWLQRLAFAAIEAAFADGTIADRIEAERVAIDVPELEQVAKRFVDDFTEHDAQDEEYHETVSALSGLLAAADAAGYERGHKEAVKTVRVDADPALKQQLTALQARYDRLAAAVEVAQRFTYGKSREYLLAALSSDTAPESEEKL